MQDTMIYDVGPGEFERKVLDASAQRPIVVDFWAPWCAPCRALSPVLEEVVRSYAGRLALAKVNVDENAELAAQCGVQGIPAVLVFRQGQAVGQFTGALPKPEVERMLASLVPSAADELVARADELLRAHDAAGAEAALREALALDERHTGALVRLGGLLLKTGDTEEARGLLSRIEEDAPEHATAQALLATMGFAEACRQGGGLDACRARAEQRPDDLDARYALACCLAAEGDHEGALEGFLGVLRADRGYRDGAPREAMVRIFALLGAESDLAKAYRRKLASALY